MSTDVKEEVARRRHGRVPRAGNLAEGMETRWTRPPEEAIPKSAAETGDAGELTLRDAKTDRPFQRADIGEQRPHLLLAAGFHAEDEEDRGLGQRRQNGLWFGCTQKGSPREASWTIDGSLARPGPERADRRLALPRLRGRGQHAAGSQPACRRDRRRRLRPHPPRPAGDLAGGHSEPAGSTASRLRRALFVCEARPGAHQGPEGRLRRSRTDVVAPGAALACSHHVGTRGSRASSSGGSRRLSCSSPGCRCFGA